MRAHILGEDGTIVVSTARPQHVIVGADGRAEVDTDDVWARVCECLTEALARVDVRRVAAVGAASALGYLFLDRDARPLGPAMLWMDRRAVREADALARAVDADALYRVTGRRLDPEVLLAKLRWLRQHEPDRLSSAATFIGLKDDVVRRLTGAIATDPTHAAYTMLYDVAARRWATELVALARVPATLLPSLSRATDIVGRVTPAAAKATGVVEGTPVVTGTSDGTAACLLAGVEAGVAVNVTGTSDVVMACADRPLHDPARRTLVNPHPLGDGFMVGGVLGTTGGTLAWFVERFCPDLVGDDRYRRLDDEAARIGPGARGVVCLTGLAGERAPRWNAIARGALVGLDVTHGRAELARAVLDGVALSVRSVVEAVRALGADVRALRVVGGGARSELWNQIRADAIGVPVERPRSVEGTATAIALLAGLGVGLYPSLAEGARRTAPIARVFEPHPDATREYEELARVTDRIHAALDATWPDLARGRAARER